MDISAEKLWVIERLIKMKDESLLHRIKKLIQKANKRGEEERLKPMSLDEFYGRIEKSDQAFQSGDIITQDELREEIKSWRET